MKSKLVTNYPSATKYLYARQRQTRRTRRTSHPPANTENKRKEWDLPIELLPASSTSLRASFALPSLHLSPPPRLPVFLASFGRQVLGPNTHTGSLRWLHSHETISLHDSASLS